MRFGLTEYADSPTQAVMSLAEAKAHLRVDFDADDALIESLIDAAALQAEAYTRQWLTPRDALMTLGSWPGHGHGAFGPDVDGDDFPARFGGSGRPSRYPNAIYFPTGPVQSVSSISYRESSTGVVTTLSASTYVVTTSTRPAFIVPATGEAWPALYDHPEAVRVAFRAGYDTPPANAVAACKLILGHLYEHREDVTPGFGAPNPAQIPMGSRYLLNPLRLFPL